MSGYRYPPSYNIHQVTNPFNHRYVVVNNTTNTADDWTVNPAANGGKRPRVPSASSTESDNAPLRSRLGPNRAPSTTTGNTYASFTSLSSSRPTNAATSILSRHYPTEDCARSIVPFASLDKVIIAKSSSNKITGFFPPRMKSDADDEKLYEPSAKGLSRCVKIIGSEQESMFAQIGLDTLDYGALSGYEKDIAYIRQSSARTRIQSLAYISGIRRDLPTPCLKQKRWRIPNSNSESSSSTSSLMGKQSSAASARARKVNKLVLQEGNRSSSSSSSSRKK